MRKFLYGVMFMIGLRRIAEGLTLMLMSEPVRNLVSDVTYTAIDRMLNGDENYGERRQRRLRERTRARTQQSHVRSVPDPEQPYDHQADGL